MLTHCPVANARVLLGRYDKELSTYGSHSQKGRSQSGPKGPSRCPSGGPYRVRLPGWTGSWDPKDLKTYCINIFHQWIVWDSKADWGKLLQRNIARTTLKGWGNFKGSVKIALWGKQIRRHTGEREQCSQFPDPLPKLLLKQDIISELPWYLHLKRKRNLNSRSQKY